MEISGEDFDRSTFREVEAIEGAREMSEERG